MCLWTWASRRATPIVSPDEGGSSVQSTGVRGALRRASFLDNAAVRKLSIAAGGFTPDSNELQITRNSSVATDDSKKQGSALALLQDGPESSTADHTTLPMLDASDKISIVAHTGHSNFRAVLTSIPASALVYFVYSYLSIVIPAAGGMWGDHHAVLCAACMFGMEAMLMAVWRFERGYMLRRVFCCAPVLWLTFILTSKFAFDDRPGHWSSALMTASWTVGGISTWPLEPPSRLPFVQHVKESVIIALVGHGGFIVVIFGQIIPTKLLSHTNPVLTSLVTGVAFPFLTWVLRKITLGNFGAIVKIAIERGRADHEGSLRTFDLFVKAASSALALTPCVLNYLNTSIKLAVVSAVLQMMSEILGKIWIVYFTRKTFADYIAAVNGERGALTKALHFASSEPGVDGANTAHTTLLRKVHSLENEVEHWKAKFSLCAAENEKLKTIIKEVDAALQYQHPASTEVDVVPSAPEKPGESQVPFDNANIVDAAAFEKKKKDIEVRLDRAMFMLASRWNAELTAEKVGIIVASLIAIVAFDTKGGVGLRTDELIIVAIIFYGMEVITDVLFVYTMDTYLHVPTLSTAINESKLVTKNALVDSGVICLNFVAIASCIKMAFMVQL